MDFNQFVTWAFYALLSMIGAYLAKTINRLQESIERINTTLAVEITKNTALKETIDVVKSESKDIEKRVQNLERKTYSCNYISNSSQ